MAATPPWLAVMQSIDGTHEVAGSGDNPTILGWATYIGQQYPDMASYAALYQHDSTAWCGLTVAYCMAKSGIRPVWGPTDTDRWLWADAWRQFGTKVSTPQLGDVLVFQWASGSHHVTLYAGTDSSGSYLCHGGNQSDAVNIQHYSPSYCRAIQRPPQPVQQPIVPPPITQPDLPAILPRLPPTVGLPPILGPGAWVVSTTIDAAIARLDSEIAVLQVTRTQLVALKPTGISLGQTPPLLPSIPTDLRLCSRFRLLCRLRRHCCMSLANARGLADPTIWASRRRKGLRSSVPTVRHRGCSCCSNRPAQLDSPAASILMGCTILLVAGTIPLPLQACSVISPCRRW